MNAVQSIQQAVVLLSRDQLRELREWFAEYDAQRWDLEIEQDIAGGRLDALTKEALDSLDRRRRGDA